MSGNENNDASSSKSFETFDDNGPPPWSNRPQDPLFIIMTKLGLGEFFAFRKVCKSWRSLALAHMNMYMDSRQPLAVSLSTDNTNACYLDDLEGRYFKTILPRSTDSTCVGLTCGYLIFFNMISRDFWLVNPFTSHEHHFPNFPYDVISKHRGIRGILVFSPSVSMYAFVFSHQLSNRISFSLSGNQAPWYDLTSEFAIWGIHCFNGKIYTITVGSRLFEMGLDPSSPTLTLLGMKNLPVYLFHPLFVNWGKNLYVVDNVSCSPHTFNVYEIDFEKMECVLIENTTLDFACFVGNRKSSAAVNPDTWADRGMRCNRFYDLKATNDPSKLKGKYLLADMWYFPGDCLSVNTLQLQ